MCTTKVFFTSGGMSGHIHPFVFNSKNGAPEEIRTPNLLIRSQMLYPVELRVRICVKSRKKGLSRER